MTQTSTVVHSINSTPQKSAGEPRKTAKNLALPLAVLLSLAVIGVPKSSPACLAPTAAPTSWAPTTKLYKPTAAPTSGRAPTAAPTTQDLKTPTAVPTIEAKPTAVPTTELKPTGVPTSELAPTAVPTTELKPTAVPTIEAKKPTATPTVAPTTQEL